jgi:Tol biopolymer transport system component
MLTLKGHLRRIWSVSWSPDGKRLASASGDRTVKVWDAITGEILFTLGGHTGEVRSVCFSPNGKRLASASQDQTVKVWDAQSGRDVLTLKGHTDGVTSVCFSPDGRRLTSASRDGTVKLWDTESGQETLTLDVHEHSMFGLAEVTWSPDGKRLAGCGGNGGDKGDMVMVWEDNPREELVKERRDGQAAISEFKKERTKWRALGDAIAEARQSEDPKAELSILEKAISEYPSLETTGLGGRKIALLIRDRNPGPAIAYGTHLLEETLKYDALALNDIAWSIVDPDAKTKPNAKLLKLGLTAAKRADELMHGKHAAVADTLAAAYAADGDLAKAAEVQAKAVALAKGTEFGKVKSLQERLERYKKALK